MVVHWPFDDRLIDQVYQLNKAGRYDEACNLVFAEHAHCFHAIEGTFTGKNVFLLGSSRVGKSLLAQALSEKLDAPVFSMDEFRRFYWHPKERYKEIADVSQCRLRFYAALMQALPAGVIFEGSDFYFSLQKNDFRVAADFIGFILGVNEADITRKADQIHRSASSGHCRSKKSYSKSLELAENSAKAFRLMQKKLADDRRCYAIDMMLEDDILSSVEAATTQCLEIIFQRSP